MTSKDMLRRIQRLEKLMKTRPTVDDYFMDMAQLVATRGTCIRRRVGCVLVNSMNHVIATGYNGVAARQPHCIDHPCPGAEYKSGEGLDKCEAIHSEANALLQCKDVYEIEKCYVTVSPCIHCTKLLLNTSCKAIYFGEQYAHDDARRLWLHAGRDWIMIHD